MRRRPASPILIQVQNYFLLLSDVYSYLLCLILSVCNLQSCANCFLWFAGNDYRCNLPRICNWQKCPVPKNAPECWGSEDKRKTNITSLCLINVFSLRFVFLWVFLFLLCLLCVWDVAVSNASVLYLYIGSCKRCEMANFKTLLAIV